MINMEITVSADCLLFQDKRSSFGVDLCAIQYIKSYGNYIQVVTDKRAYLVQLTTRRLADLLPKEIFVRIHKSFIVNMTRIEQYDCEQIVIGNRRLPVGKTYKQLVKHVLEFQKSDSRQYQANTREDN
jgi:DNA-binding LytR/AlgR family response regulator